MRTEKFLVSILILLVGILLADFTIAKITDNDSSLKSLFCDHKYGEATYQELNSEKHVCIRQCTKCGSIKRTREKHEYEACGCVDTGEFHEEQYCCTKCHNKDYPATVEPHSYDANNKCVCGHDYVAREILTSVNTRYAITRPRNGEFGQNVYVLFAGSGEMGNAMEIFKYTESEDSIIIVTQTGSGGWTTVINGIVPVIESFSQYYDIHLLGFSAGGPAAMNTARKMVEKGISSRNDTLHVVDGCFDLSNYDIFVQLAKNSWNVHAYTRSGNSVGSKIIREKESNPDDPNLAQITYKSYATSHGAMDNIVFEEVMGVPVP